MQDLFSGKFEYGIHVYIQLIQQLQAERNRICEKTIELVMGSYLNNFQSELEIKIRSVIVVEIPVVSMKS